MINKYLIVIFVVMVEILGGAGSSAQGRRSPAATAIEISAADCARLATHVPSADTAYRPGVDAVGRPVVPAEGPAGAPPLLLPEVYVIEITADLQKRFNLPPNAKLYAGEAKIGIVTVGGDGGVAFNGEPVLAEEQALLARLCQERGRRPHGGPGAR